MKTPHVRQVIGVADSAMEGGDWPRARAGFLQALSLEPDNAHALLQLSYVESFVDDYRAAREWALRAAATHPTQPHVLLELARRLRTFNEVPVLRATAMRLLADARTPHAVLVEYANQLGILNDSGLALRCAEAAFARAPNDPGVRLVHGQLLAHHGRVEEAVGDFEWVLARNPRVGPAWWMLSRLRKQTPRSNHVAQLRNLLATPGLSARSVAAAARALHKELDDIGNHDGAWQALQLMCEARRSTLEYATGDSRSLIDALIAMPTRIANEGCPTDRTPIFIVGMHRSGTTLLEQLLDASPQVRGIGELNDFACAMRYATNHYCKGVIDTTQIGRMGGVDFDEVGRRYLDGIAWRLGDETHFTDKLPSNFLNAGSILRALPRAKILHMVRDPMETCFSNLRELFSDVNPFSYDQVELGEYFVQYRRLMAHWHAAFPGRILDVDYARLTSDTEAVMRKVAAFCGLDYVDGMRSTSSSRRAISTASSVQAREDVTVRETPKWVPYAEYLRPLAEVLRANGIVAGRCRGWPAGRSD